MQTPRSPWRRQAAHDLEQAKAAPHAGAYDWAAYGSRQAVERLFVHLTIRAGAPFERTHDRTVLAADLRQAGMAPDELGALLDDLRESTQMNLVARYPLGDGAAPVDLITRRQAERAIETADRAFAVADAFERGAGERRR